MSGTPAESNAGFSIRANRVYLLGTKVDTVVLFASDSWLTTRRNLGALFGALATWPTVRKSAFGEKWAPNTTRSTGRSSIHANTIPGELFAKHSSMIRPPRRDRRDATAERTVEPRAGSATASAQQPRPERCGNTPREESAHPVRYRIHVVRRATPLTTCKPA